MRRFHGASIAYPCGRKYAFIATLFFVVSALTLLPSATSAATIGKITANNIGLVGWWTFDGPDLLQNAKDKSGQGNTGYLAGFTSTTTVPGKIGQALQFDGSNDYVQIADHDNLTPANITITYWVKPANLGVGTQNIISKRTSGNVGGYVFESVGSNSVLHFFYVGGWHQATVAYTNGQWQHIAVTYDGETIRVYRNAGTPELNTNPSGDLNNDTAVLRLGKDSEQSDALHFDGSIDDVRIYNRALSATEVAALYKSGEARAGSSRSGPNAPLSNGLVGHWTFDGGATDWRTNTTNDVSGQGNTGTLVAMSTTTSPTPGKIGQALNFDGTTQYVRANLSSLVLPITASAWIYPTRGPGFNQVIVSSDSGVNNGWRMYTNSLTLGFVLGDVADYLCSQNVTLNAWNHVVVAATGNNGTVICYINGVKNTPISIGTMSGSPTQIQLGFDFASEAFRGSLDDVRIYNRALSPTEVAELYKTGAAEIGHSNVGISDGLVGWWNFDGPSMDWRKNQVADKSGQGNTGTLVSMSTTTSPVKGKIGQALKFNGSSSYVATPSGAFNFNTSGTVSLWVKDPENAGRIASFKKSGQEGWRIQGTSFQSGIDSYNFVYSDVTGPDDSCFSLGGIKPGTWSLISVVVDREAGVYRCYLNGTLYQSTAISRPAISTTDSLYFGASGIPDGFFSGSIDDVRIYNRALSPQEIQQLYNMGR